MRKLRWATIAAAGMLVIAVILWSAAPISAAGPGARIAVILAIVSGVACLVQLVVATATLAESSGFDSPLERLARGLVTSIRALPWPELLIIAVLALEALHRSRPWHTAVLGVALLGLLLSVHLAETGAAVGVLRRQVPVIAAGIGLTALAVGASALPGLPSGPASSVVRVIAALAAVVACALAVPTWLSRDR